MRILAVVALGIVATFAPIQQAESAADSPTSGCMTACDAARDKCEKAADAEVEKCKERAFEPCNDWCPCDQFIGAAHFACIPECERCKLDAEDEADRCPDGSAAKAECASAHRRCTERCESSE